MLRYAITNRFRFGISTAKQQAGLIAQAERLARDEVDFIQLREKDLSASELVMLVRRMVLAVEATGSATRILVNSRPDVALAAGADGVHIASGIKQLSAQQVRTILGKDRACFLSISCHILAEVQRATDYGIDLILFGPVFEKSVKGENVGPGVGLEALRAACSAAAGAPVLALGGVTQTNSALCLEAGAAGIAGIRLFE